MNSGPFILLHPDDNVLVCRQHAFRGQSITLDGEIVVLPDEITVGHKIARHDLKAGEKIIKYGAPIGSMKTDAARAAHIHMHNMQSDYIKSHTREVTGHGH
jgi:hypothetical protein